MPPPVRNRREAWLDNAARDREAARPAARFERHFDSFAGAVGEEVREAAIRAAA